MYMHKLCLFQLVPDFVTFILIVYCQKLSDDDAENTTREYNTMVKQPIEYS